MFTHRLTVQGGNAQEWVTAESAAREIGSGVSKDTLWLYESDR
jgi:hypothetical protein